MKTTTNVPIEVIKEARRLKLTFPKAEILYNAATETHFVSILPLSLTNSLFIQKLI